jgi:1,6-anhydro-N-acetylmuramate kinase
MPPVLTLQAAAYGITILHGVDAALVSADREWRPEHTNRNVFAPRTILANQLASCILRPIYIQSVVL